MLLADFYLYVNTGRKTEYVEHGYDVQRQGVMVIMLHVDVGGIHLLCEETDLQILEEEFKSVWRQCFSQRYAAEQTHFMYVQLIMH